MNDPLSLIAEVVSIKNPLSENEKGFGIIVKYYSVDDTYEIHMSNGHAVFTTRENVIEQKTKSEAICKLRSIVNDFYSRIDKCGDKECVVCPHQKDKYNEALNLIELLKIL